ncbi:MAG TPA: hypothetical protein VHU81_02700 [Thermoanaerobaculia bacterium]|nr:hypothetical protein [Thermoanaerobaculia bacterium]
MPPPEEGENYSGVVLQEGASWQLVNASGYAADDGGQYYNQNLYMLQSAAGAYNAPLPPGIQTELAGSADNEDTVFIVDQRIIDEIAASEQNGYLSPYLNSIAEPQDYDPYEPLEPSPMDTMARFRLFGRCSDKEVTKSKTLNLSNPITLQNFNMGSGFSGTLQASGDVQGTATGEVRILLKRYAIFGACVPYGVKFDRARAYGNMLVNYGATLSGTINYQSPPDWEWEITKPRLFSLDFFLGPIPVHIGFNLPITVGLELNASLTGSVTYNTGQSAQGAFDYTCFLGSGCYGWSNFVQNSAQPAQTLTGSVSGHIKPSIYAQAALRAYLYNEWIAYAQVGIRPYVHGDLWGYYGNNCGDANGDGWFETVDALTFDLDWQLRVTAAAAAFGGNPKRWTLWSSAYWHIGWWDLIGSEALEPMLVSPASVPVNTSQRYDAKMRPCWPYGDNVSYQLNWNDGTAPASLNGSPQVFVSTYKTWPAQGTVTPQLTALSDSHGRTFNRTTTRNIQVGAATGTWTGWMARDAPSGTGDWELIGDLRAAGFNICNGAAPIGIDCQTTNGVDWRNTGEVYTCDPNQGGICQNNLQTDGSCLDYQVRFLCQ